MSTLSKISIKDLVWDSMSLNRAKTFAKIPDNRGLVTVEKSVREDYICSLVNMVYKDDDGRIHMGASKIVVSQYDDGTERIRVSGDRNFSIYFEEYCDDWEDEFVQLSNSGIKWLNEQREKKISLDDIKWSELLNPWFAESNNSGLFKYSPHINGVYDIEFRLQVKTDKEVEVFAVVTDIFSNKRHSSQDIKSQDFFNKVFYKGDLDRFLDFEKKYHLNLG